METEKVVGKVRKVIMTVEKMIMKAGKTILLVASFLCFCMWLLIQLNSQSAIHEIVAALYLLMALVSFCSLVIIGTITKKSL